LDTDCLPEPGYLAGEKFENLTPKQRDKKQLGKGKSGKSLKTLAALVIIMVERYYPILGNEMCISRMISFCVSYTRSAIKSQNCSGLPMF